MTAKYLVLLFVAFVHTRGVQAQEPVTQHSFEGGVHLGIGIGRGWGSNDARIGPGVDSWSQVFWNPAFNKGRIDRKPETKVKGFFLHAQMGYDWRLGNVLMGIAGDAQLGNRSGSHTLSLPAEPVSWTETWVDITSRTSQSVSLTTSLRGRIGVVSNEKWLGYLTGGVAGGQVRHEFHMDADDSQDHQNMSDHSFALGYVIGGGVEMPIRTRYRIRMEYRYLDLGKAEHRTIGTGRTQNSSTYFETGFADRHQELLISACYLLGTTRKGSGSGGPRAHGITAAQEASPSASAPRSERQEQATPSPTHGSRVVEPKAHGASGSVGAAVVPVPDRTDETRSTARTRYHFSGILGYPEYGDVSLLQMPLVGGSLGVEFGTREIVRPVIEGDYLYGFSTASGKDQGIGDVQMVTGLAGMKVFFTRRQNGPYISILGGGGQSQRGLSQSSYYYWGPRTVEAEEFAVVAYGAGLVLFDRIDLGYQYRIPFRIAPLEPPNAISVIKAGFFLGGARRGSAAPRKDSVKGRLAHETARADSVAEVAERSMEQVRGLEKQQRDLLGEIDQRDARIEDLGVKMDSLSNRPAAGNTTDALRYKPLTEDPSRFSAISVYTVLHVFSDPTRLDTFRVVTTRAPNGGLRHELRIRTVGGKIYREELYDVPLEGFMTSTSDDEELEMLRVRMAISPGAFLTAPVSQNDWQLSDQRGSRDLVYRDIPKEDFARVFADAPPVGIRFQSDEGTEKVLVYSRSLDRIVNIKPE